MPALNVKLKVCGITSLKDAEAAISVGANFLGFNFYPQSPRFIEPMKARAIIQMVKGLSTAVGIFVNEASPAEVIRKAEASGVEMIQLHGDEDARFCELVGPERVIKALRVSEDFDPGTVVNVPATAVLLDAFDKERYGGTGSTVNWKIASVAARLARVILAGGLGPKNIASAIHEVYPFAVDVNSGVEISPGRKDIEKLRMLRMEMEK